MSEEMGIDEFARRCDTTVRMVREYQTLGVLLPPEKVGRTAVYGEAHLARWKAVARLQERGYSLAAIADLFRAWESGSSLPSVLGLAGTAVGALDETPAVVDAAQLAREVPGLFTEPALVRRATAAGLVHRRTEATYAVRSPALVQLVADAIAAGIPVDQVLDIVEAIDTGTAGIATVVLAVIEAAIAADDGAELGPFLLRGRPLLAQAVASTLIGHLGTQLTDAAQARPDLAHLLETLRIGVVNDTTTPTGR